MKTFLGIGVSHVDEVFDFVYRTLSEFRPDAITLEAQISFTNVGEVTSPNDRVREDRFYKKLCKIRYEESRGDVEQRVFGLGRVLSSDIRQLRLFLDDLCVLNGSCLEFNPVLAYVLENGVPFYFTDVPLGDKSIVEFTRERYRIIPLDEEAELTQDIPSESLCFRRDDITRNKFAADAINYLFSQGKNCVAHVCGTGNFNVQYPHTEQWDPYPEDYLAHIQDFVKSDRIFIADTNTSIVHQLKG